jgi:Na+-driven multidrug efflux pump
VQRRIQKIVYVFAVIGIVLLILAPWVIRNWMEGKVTISFNLNFSMFVFSLFYMLLSSKNYFLNGIGKIKIQKRILIITAFLHFLLSYLLGVILNGGVVGVLWGTNISILINVIVCAIQVRRINTDRATGIWNE